ncbi:F0F1 ATP synthase subunit B [Lactobacillaceae bacterium 24-114]
MFVNSVIAESNSLYIGDLVFYIVTFIILMLLIKHFAWKPVTEMMKKRADKIANDIDIAAKSRESAEKMAAKRQTELQNSRQEAAEIINNAKKSGEAQRTQIVESAQNDAQALKQRAQEDANQARRDALNSAKDDVANLSIEIASKLIQKELNADDQKALIDSYIEGLVDHES